MRLGPFILANIEAILEEWEAFARALSPGTTMTKLALRNDAEGILLATVRDMQSPQSVDHQVSKSRGLGGAGGTASDELDLASETHGVGRLGSGFDIMELVSEYRALRASVLRLWRRSSPQPSLSDLDDITRFNESMDQSLATAVNSYTQRVDQSRRMFLAILSHDLRNPLHCIRMAAFVVSRKAGDSDAAEAASQIETNSEAIARLISDLIDFASTGLGTAMPLTREPVDLGRLCREVVESFRTAHRHRLLRYCVDNELTGDWDASRLRQVLSNLIGNALQHGSASDPVELSLTADGSIAELCVHNGGPEIPPEMLATIFDPMVRQVSPESTGRRVQGSVGLGLYIVREIVVSHGGTITVDSTTQEGTTFRVRLPGLHRAGGAEQGGAA